MHWEGVYRDRRPEETSWHQDDPQASLRLIESSGAAIGDPVIDIGGGASRLVDRLLGRGYADLSVLDISGRALDEARTRLGPEAARVRWIEADVTAFDPDRRYRLWHDRAAFHFLIDPTDRLRYRTALSAGLEVGGWLVIAAFAPDGPPRCSGLDVVRYDADSLAAELGSGFELEEESREIHLTPQGKEQRFGFFRFRRRA
jgi:hypothetical protein